MTKPLIRTVSQIATFFAASCTVNASAQDKPDYSLGAGDAIRVLVFQNPDLTVEARVSENGSITYPLIGAVELGGLSIAAAESKIASELKSASEWRRCLHRKNGSGTIEKFSPEMTAPEQPNDVIYARESIF